MQNPYNYQNIFLVFLLCFFAAIVPLSAHAGAMQTAICFILNDPDAGIQGTMGTGMAMLAICAVAAAAALGKASWGMALTVCTGIAILFGAAGLAETLLGTTSSGC